MATFATDSWFCPPLEVFLPSRTTYICKYISKIPSKKQKFYWVTFIQGSAATTSPVMLQITYASVGKKHIQQKLGKSKQYTRHMPLLTFGCRWFISLSLMAFHELVLIASLPATNLYCSPTVSASDISFL